MRQLSEMRFALPGESIENCKKRLPPERKCKLVGQYDKRNLQAKVTIIQGDPGEGKTTLVLQIIARLTKGESIIDENKNLPINVIYQTAEDGLADTIKPRLLAANADCSKVLVIDDSDTPLTMRDARLEQAIIET
jgi:DNA replication protein DnaC